jgi:hypothetical protein
MDATMSGIKNPKLRIKALYERWQCLDAERHVIADKMFIIDGEIEDLKREIEEAKQEARHGR